jgi:hypothetical protein
MVNLVFEWINVELGSQPLQITKFLHKQENGFYKLSFNNYSLNEPAAKSIAVLIPFLVNVVEVEFINNKMEDHITSALAMAIFMNPTITSFRFNSNYLKGCTINALSGMMKA